MASTVAPPSTSPPSPVLDRRRASASVILRSVLEHGPVARSTISRLTGLSPASVTDYCARFTERGLIREAAAPHRSGGVGRPHLPIDLDHSRFVVGGVHVAVPYTTVALLDLRGRVLAEKRLRHDRTEPGLVLANAADGIAALLAGARGRTPLGIGVAAAWLGRPGLRHDRGAHAAGLARRRRPGGRRGAHGAAGPCGRPRTGVGQRGAAVRPGPGKPERAASLHAATWWTPPSPRTTRCTTGPARRPVPSPISP